MKINIIVAFSKNRGIGINNSLPWSISNDLKKFKKLTIGDGNNAVIMGKNTWSSLPCNYLQMRDNLILSKSLLIDTCKNNQETKKEENTRKYKIKSFESIDSIMKFCYQQNYDYVWIIGGESIYKQFMMNNVINIDKIYVTYIDNDFKYDTTFPNIDSNIYSLTEEVLYLENINLYDFKIFDRIYSKIQK